MDVHTSDEIYKLRVELSKTDTEIINLKRGTVAFIRYEFAGTFDDLTDEELLQYVLNFKDDGD